MKKLHQKLISKLRPPKKSDPSEEKEHTLALHTVYTDPNPGVDIIVLHGHTGHYRDSFTHQPTNCFWLKDLLPSVFHNLPGSERKNIRVFSFSYSKQDETLLGSEKIVHFLGQQILSQQPPNQQNQNKKPIIFIAHSFGGSLLQGLLAAPENDWLRSQTVGILFFGVAKGSGWGNLVGAMGDVKEEELSQEMRDMRREVEWLRGSERGFEDFEKRGRWDLRWFREGDGGVGNGERFEREGDTNLIFINRTHGAMARFEREDDEEWKKVKGVLIEVATRTVN